MAADASQSALQLDSLLASLAGGPTQVPLLLPHALCSRRHARRPLATPRCGGDAPATRRDVATNPGRRRIPLEVNSTVNSKRGSFPPPLPVAQPEGGGVQEKG